MRFSRIGPLSVVSRITGPTHHWLGLELTENQVPSTVLESVSADGTLIQTEAFDTRQRLVDDVSRGVEEANRRNGTRFTVKTIRYCRDDRYVPGVYREMAESLVDHAEDEVRTEIAAMTFQELDARGAADERA